MKKRFLFLLLACILICGLTVSASAVTMPLVCDQADLLTDTQEASLLARLETVSGDTGIDVVVVTVNSTDGKTPQAFADDFYDENGYGQGADRDGVLLLVSMEESDWHISTCGYGITAFTDAGIAYIGKQFATYLSDGKYAEAFDEFASQCEAFIAQARTGDPYDRHNLPKEPFGWITAVIIALVVGFVIGKIYAGRLKGELNTVRRQTAATNYVRSGSLNIHQSSELFLYRTLNKTAKESGKGSSTHRSSSGTTHGGGGGKF